MLVVENPLLSFSQLSPLPVKRGRSFWAVTHLNFCLTSAKTPFYFSHKYDYNYMEKIVDMKTIQMTIDEKLLKELDRTIRQLRITRSAFIRESIVYYLRRKKIIEMEMQQRAGYESNPVGDDEFSNWEDEQVWGG